MSRIEAIQKVLEIYGRTNHPVSQEFYKALCIEAAEAIDKLLKEKEKPDLLE